MKWKWTNNLGLKVLSVLIACVIWLIVMDNNDPERTQVYRNVPVTIVNQDTLTDANKTYTVVDGTDKVNVYVTARRSVRARLTAASFVVKADLENYNEDLGAVPLDVSCLDIAVSQESMRIQPPSLKISLEDKIEENFGIVATVSGKTMRGYELGKATILTGDNIRIAGPRSLINIIGKVTVPVDVNNLSKNTTVTNTIRIEDKNGAVLTESQMSNLELKDSNGVILQGNQAEVDMQIWKVYEEIPLEAQLSGEPAPGYEVTGITVSPKTVNLTAPKKQMDRLGDKLVLSDILSIAGASTNQEFTVDLNDTLSAHKNIRLAADYSPIVTVTVRIDEVGSKTFDFPVAQIELQNVPENKTLIFSPTDRIAVNIRASEENLRTFSTDTIQATVDLGACGENGSYQLPVQITLPAGYELGEEVSIVVNVADKQEGEANVETTEEENIR